MCFIFLAISVTVTETKHTIDESAGVLKIDLMFDRPSPFCFNVYVEGVNKIAEGKLHVRTYCVHI